MQIKIVEHTYTVPDSVAFRPSETLDEHNSSYRIALSPSWYEGEEAKAVSRVCQMLKQRAKEGFIPRVIISNDTERAEYIYVSVDVTEQHGYLFVELEVGLDGLNYKEL